MKTQEEAMETFFENLKKIEEHNRNEAFTFKLGLTEDSDLNYEEIRKQKTGAKRSTRFKRSHATAPFNYHQQMANFTPPKFGKKVEVGKKSKI